MFVTTELSAASEVWEEHGDLIIAAVWGAVLVAVVALALTAVAVLQRLRPLQRAIARAQERQIRAQRVVGELNTVASKLAAKKKI